MNHMDVLQIIKGGESSKVQFKELGSKNILADETETFDSSIKDVDIRLFSEYFKKKI